MCVCVCVCVCVCEIIIYIYIYKYIKRERECMISKMVIAEGNGICIPSSNPVCILLDTNVLEENNLSILSLEIGKSDWDF